MAASGEFFVPFWLLPSAHQSASRRNRSSRSNGAHRSVLTSIPVARWKLKITVGSRDKFITINNLRRTRNKKKKLIIIFGLRRMPFNFSLSFVSSLWCLLLFDQFYCRVFFFLLCNPVDINCRLTSPPWVFFQIKKQFAMQSVPLFVFSLDCRHLLYSDPFFSFSFVYLLSLCPIAVGHTAAVIVG